LCSVYVFQLARSIKLEEEESVALAEVSRNIFCKFSEKKQLWDSAVQAVAQLDALLRLELEQKLLSPF